MKRVNYDKAWKAVKFLEDGGKLYTKEGEGKYTQLLTVADVVRYFYRLYSE